MKKNYLLIIIIAILLFATTFELLYIIQLKKGENIREARHNLNAFNYFYEFLNSSVDNRKTSLFLSKKIKKPLNMHLGDNYNLFSYDQNKQIIYKLAIKLYCNNNSKVIFSLQRDSIEFGKKITTMKTTSNGLILNSAHEDSIVYNMNECTILAIPDREQKIIYLMKTKSPLKNSTIVKILKEPIKYLDSPENLFAIQIHTDF